MCGALQGMVALRKHADRIIVLLEAMAEGGTLPVCVQHPELVRLLSERLCVGMLEDQLMVRAESMVHESVAALSTRL